MIAHALAILREVGLEAAIAGALPDFESTLAAYAPIVPDSRSGLGPLAGICAALAATSARYVVFLPIDMPLLPASLIEYLLHHAQMKSSAVTVPSVNGFDQTFPVVLDRSVLPALQSELDSRRCGCFAAFQIASKSLGQTVAGVAVELLAQSGQVAHPLGLAPLRWFLNVNTPPDHQRAEALWTRAVA